MKLTVFKNFFKSILFFIKHFFLVALTNCFTFFVLNKFAYQFLKNQIHIGSSNYLTLLISIIIILFSIYIKYSFYLIAINNDIEEIENEIFIYFSDFFSNIIYGFSSTILYIFLFIISIPFIIPTIIVLNLCPYYMIYSCIRKKTVDARGKYMPFESISQSFKITKDNRIKLIFFNSILFFLIGFGLINLSESILLYGFEVSYVFKIFMSDFLIVYIIRTGFNLDKIENEKQDEITRKEIEKEYNIMRGNSDINTDTFIQTTRKGKK